MDGYTMAQLENMPAMAPPPGYTTDFNNPGKDGSNATETVITLSVLLGITILVLLLRLYTRFVILKAPAWDDYCALAATIGAIAYSALVIHIFQNGFGVHQWNVRSTTLLELTDYLNAVLYIYKPFMLLAKLSICIFLLQVFGSNKRLRWAIYFAIAYNVVLQVSAFFLSIFLCLPGRPSFWACSHVVSTLNVGTAACNIFADFYLLLLPVIGVRRLQMPLGRKILVILVFAVGLLACIASILGLTYRIRQNKSSDVSWNFSPEIILVTFELEATIIVGSVLLLPALFRSTHPYSLGSAWSNGSQLLKSSVSKWSLSSSKQNSTHTSTQDEKYVARGSITQLPSRNGSAFSGPKTNASFEYAQSNTSAHSKHPDPYALDAV